MAGLFHAIFGGGNKTPRDQVPGSKEWTAAQLKPLTALETQVGQFGLSEAQKEIPKAENALDTSLDFYKKLMTGSYDDLTKLFDTSSLTKSADQAQEVNAQIGSRSGPRAAVLGETTESRSGDLNRFFETLRAQAPGQVAGIGQMISNMGAQLLSGGQSGVSGAEGLITDVTQLRQNEINKHAQLINGILGMGGSIAGAIAAHGS